MNPGKLFRLERKNMVEITNTAAFMCVCNHLLHISLIKLLMSPGDKMHNSTLTIIPEIFLVITFKPSHLIIVTGMTHTSSMNSLRAKRKTEKDPIINRQTFAVSLMRMFNL